VERANVLVVFYSRSGFTRAVAHALAEALGADLEELADTKNRAGFLGYLKSGLDGALGRLTELKPLSKRPGNYDVLVIGTPIWNASISSPVRTFLRQHKAALKQVAFFCTYGGSGNERVLGRMAALCGKAPLGTMAVRDRDVGGPKQDAQIRDLVDRLQATAAAQPRRDPVQDEGP
jgi:flavodoxin